MATQWPPRSPHEVLLSTPSGREKLRRMADRMSPSPSPSRLRTTQSATSLASGTGKEESEDVEMFDGGDPGGEEEEEDEETLQLKLQAIQARLRLKKLRAAKAQKKAAAAAAVQGSGSASGPGSQSGEGPGGRPGGEPGTNGGAGMREVPLQSKLAAVRDRLDRQASRDVVQVPASPVKKSQSFSDLQTSPQRVLLGIDKGLRGADVSLKRAPGQRARADSQPVQPGGYLRRTNSSLDGQKQEASRPLSFNERLASARLEETARQERRQRAEKARSTAFSIGKEEMEQYKAKALELPDIPSKPQEFSREEVLSAAAGQPSGGRTRRSNTVPDVRQGAASTTSSTTATTANIDLEGGAFEPYSGLHLSKRILPHNVLARAVSGKKPYLLKDLLRQVKAPDWSLPDDETDIVVFAIIASKSDPRSHRAGPEGDGKPRQDRGKYMVLTLVDLTYEVDLFLFNSGFDRFWKLTPGTVVAILNPSIMPPPPGREATNRFGLVINSDEDTILEIGNARDIGYCKSIKKDGSCCKAWVNARRTEYCEYHTNEAVRKARSSRIELSTTAGFGGDGPRGRSNSRQIFARPGEDRQRGFYDRATQSQYFISTAHRSTDPDDERITGIADRKEREENLKRRLEQREKERDIARRLSEMGAGAGKEYMTRAASRRTTTTTTTTSGPVFGSSFSSATSSFSSNFPTSSATTSATSIGTASNSFQHPDPQQRQQQQKEQERPRWDARALGLVGRRGSDQPKIDLGPAPTTTTTTAAPAKRKRPESSSSSIGGGSQEANTRAPLGWGAGLREKLSKMRDGERLDGRKLAPTVTSAAAAAAAAAALGTGPGGGGLSVAAAARRDDKSPVRKKTRFVTDKGIREAGRDSLGEPLSAAVKARRQVVFDDDDDDDIIIVK
ncbi:hypothetical protein VTH82DRAFT_7449 [Thermothelomyces myriococcoides]